MNRNPRVRIRVRLYGHNLKYEVQFRRWFWWWGGRVFDAAEAAEMHVAPFLPHVVYEGIEPS